MKILFVSIVGNVLDKNTWSGTTYYLHKHLSNHYEVFQISSLRGLKKPFEIIFRILNILFNKRILLDTSIILTKLYAFKIKLYLIMHRDIDLVISDSSIPLTFLKSHVKKIVYTDSNFFCMINYYDQFKNLSFGSKRRGNYLEERSLNNVDKIIYSSEWAKNSSVEAYGISEAKIHVIPFGLNLDRITNIAEVFERIKIRSENYKLKLIFIGRNWIRKGGNIAYKTMLNLRKNHNFDAYLTVIGCLPQLKNKYVNEVGFLDRNINSDYGYLNNLISESHFLILPTQADCTPMVCAEANSHGVPVVVTDTGGVSSIVNNGVNGFLVQDYNNEKGFADRIASVIKNKEKYIKLCYSSRNYCENHLTWESNIPKLIDIIESFN